MDEIFKSIKAYLYDRAASPLVGAFIVGWSMWNYRIFLIVFAGKEQSVEAIFNSIDFLFQSFSVSVWVISIPINGIFYNGLLIPSLLTASYIYLYPMLAKPVYEHSLKKQKELREIKQQEENNRLLSVEESREIYRQLADLKAENIREAESYTKQISSLRQTINDLEKELSSEVTQADKLRETPYDDINDADPEEFDNIVRNGIETMADRDFQLSDLFTSQQWTSLDSTLKKGIGKRLKMKLDRGDFLGVSQKRKGTGGQQIYTKQNQVKELKPKRELSPEREKILKMFAGIQEGYGKMESGIHKHAGGHIETVRMHIHDLQEGSYIGRSGTTDEGQTLYELKPKGRKYLVEHNLLELPEEA